MVKGGKAKSVCSHVSKIHRGAKQQAINNHRRVLYHAHANLTSRERERLIISQDIPREAWSQEDRDVIGHWLEPVSRESPSNWGPIYRGREADRAIREFEEEDAELQAYMDGSNYESDDEFLDRIRIQQEEGERPREDVQVKEEAPSPTLVDEEDDVDEEDANIEAYLAGTKYYETEEEFLDRITREQEEGRPYIGECSNSKEEPKEESREELKEESREEPKEESRMSKEEEPSYKFDIRSDSLFPLVYPSSEVYPYWLKYM